MLFSFRHPLQSLKSLQRLKKLIQTFQPNLIHIHQLNLSATMAVIANKSYKIPVLATAWGSDVLVNPQHSIILKKMLQYTLNHADWFTSDSQFMADKMQDYAANLIPITICNYGIELQQPERGKESLIFSNRRLNPLYRIDKIIIAFSKFRRNHPEWKLVIGATGSQMEALKALTQSLNLAQSVEFVEWLTGKQNYEYYAKAKIWISIPESDATAISLLEAMYCGCIPVVSQLPANCEWIEDEVNGIVVNDLDEDFLERALHIDIAHCIEKNRELVIKEGSKEANRVKFLQLYQQLIRT
jgi:glycosyltransferase involved in cell wall biosynthesis